ncbi:hypothetical protein WJX82_003705 [Trebouxia sp. C0006]
MVLTVNWVVLLVICHSSLCQHTQQQDLPGKSLRCLPYGGGGAGSIRQAEPTAVPPGLQPGEIVDREQELMSTAGLQSLGGGAGLGQGGLHRELRIVPSFWWRYLLPPHFFPDFQDPADLTE